MAGVQRTSARLNTRNTDHVALYGNNYDGYHMSNSRLDTTAIHSGVLADGETGSVYIKCFDVKEQFLGEFKLGNIF